MHCFECGNKSANNQGNCDSCGKPLEIDPDRYFKAGMEAMASGDLGDAIDFLTDCTDLSPEHLNGRYNLGLALSLANRCEEAIRHYLTIAERQPEYPGIYTALGQASFGSFLTHIEEAEAQRDAMIQFLMMAVEQDPDDVDAYFSLGNAYIAIDDGESALPWLKTALRLHPDSSAIHFTIAKALRMQEKYPEAVEMAQKAVDLSGPDDPFWMDIQALLSQLQRTLVSK